jgi:hypothetical protein
MPKLITHQGTLDLLVYTKIESRWDALASAVYLVLRTA